MLHINHLTNPLKLNNRLWGNSKPTAGLPVAASVVHLLATKHLIQSPAYRNQPGFRQSPESMVLRLWPTSRSFLHASESDSLSTFESQSPCVSRRFAVTVFHTQHLHQNPPQLHPWAASWQLPTGWNISVGEGFRKNMSELKGVIGARRALRSTWWTSGFHQPSPTFGPSNLPRERNL